MKQRNRFFAVAFGAALLALSSGASAQTTFEFGLDGSQENPPVVSAAAGTAVGVLNAGETAFDLTITHDVANPTMAHIHIGDPGVNGPVVFDLGSPVSPIVVTWNLSASDVNDLLDGELYVNIHSTDEPSGEIRGQIVVDCKPGTINAGVGPVADVLFINGSTGGSTRSIGIDSNQPFLWGTMLLPPGAGNGKYVVHADLGTPTGATARVLPADIGTTCFPFLLSDGATPSIIANNIGKENAVGASELFGTPTSDPPRAPAIFLQLNLPDANLPTGTIITFQGIEFDPQSVSVKSASTTNAVVVEML